LLPAHCLLAGRDLARSRSEHAFGPALGRTRGCSLLNLAAARVQSARLQQSSLTDSCPRVPGSRCCLCEYFHVTERHSLRNDIWICHCDERASLASEEAISLWSKADRFAHARGDTARVISRQGFSPIEERPRLRASAGSHPGGLPPQLCSSIPITRYRINFGGILGTSRCKSAKTFHCSREGLPCFLILQPHLR
jgi:hypothetical protein